MTDDSDIWVGRATPTKDTPLARDYWGSSIKVAILAKKHAPATMAAQLSKLAGTAVLDLQCVDCGEPCIATSRSVAHLHLSDDAKDRRFRGGSRYRCIPCNQQHKIAVMRADYQKRQAERDRADELRWMPYREYLGTDDWSRRRRAVISRAGFRCQVCASDGKLHVHHRTYARRGVERENDLIALCASCHELFHTHGKLADGGRSATLSPAPAEAAE